MAIATAIHTSKLIKMEINNRVPGGLNHIYLYLALPASKKLSSRYRTVTITVCKSVQNSLHSRPGHSDRHFIYTTRCVKTTNTGKIVWYEIERNSSSFYNKMKVTVSGYIRLRLKRKYSFSYSAEIKYYGLHFNSNTKRILFGLFSFSCNGYMGNIKVSTDFFLSKQRILC